MPPVLPADHPNEAAAFKEAEKLLNAKLNWPKPPIEFQSSGLETSGWRGTHPEEKHFKWLWTKIDEAYNEAAKRYL